MKKVGRRQSMPQATRVGDDPEDDADDTGDAPIIDPASVATELLLARVLGEADPADSPAGQDGTATVLTVPSADWVDPTLEAWRRLVRRDQQFLGSHGSGDFYGGRWLALAARKKPSFTEDAWAAETFAKRIAHGLHCFGVAPDPAWLPTDLSFAADHRLVLPVLSGADVHALVERVCGDRPTEEATDSMAARLTPRLLRLARRPGQSADGYLRKLTILLEHEQSAAAPLRRRTLDTPRTAPTLDRLHGMDEAVEWGRNVARDLAAYAEGTLAWPDVDRGCLFSGPPGCGKTLLARALAATCGVPLVSGSYSQWHGSGHTHQGDLMKAMRQTFADARDQAPCILFIDEVDSFPDRGAIRHHYIEWETQVVNALLAEVDGVQGRDGVVLMAACNYPDRLDPALVRSGRLDRHIRIGLPDRTALAAILGEHLGADADVWDLSRAALFAYGSSGADCERHVRGARRRARAQGRPVQLDDLMAELSSTADTEADTRLAAVHEAGHAVAAALLLPGSLAAVSLRARADRGGSVRTTTMPTYITATDLSRQIVVALAGRAAEEVILGVPSSGSGGPSGSDLAIATGLATMSAGALGFDTDLGLAWRGMPDPRDLPEMMAQPGMEVSVSRALRQAYDAALSLMRDRHATVEALAAELVAHTVLDGDAVKRVLAREVVS